MMVCKECGFKLRKLQDICGFTNLQCDNCGYTTFICNVCGEELHSKTADLSCGLFCYNCNEWKIVTSVCPSKEELNTIYKVIIRLGEIEDIKKLYYLSKICGISFSMLKDNREKEISVASGKMIDLQPVLEKLTEHGIHFVTQPVI